MTDGRLARLGACFVLACAACGGAGPGAAVPDEPPPIARLHQAKCGACHEPVMPGDKPPAVIEAAMRRHRNRLHLREDEWAELVAWLSAPRDAAQGGGGPR